MNKVVLFCIVYALVICAVYLIRHKARIQGSVVTGIMLLLLLLPFLAFGPGMIRMYHLQPGAEWINVISYVLFALVLNIFVYKLITWIKL